jgi:hypothetical protein
MQGIYLTEEGKRAIEDELTELHSQWNKNDEQTWGKIFTLKEILSSATVLPVREDWEKCVHYTLVPFFENDLPNGVIIEKNKQS